MIQRKMAYPTGGATNTPINAKNTLLSDLKFQENVDKEIERAEEELAKVYQELANNRADKAIDHFKKVWKHAQFAIEFARGF